LTNTDKELLANGKKLPLVEEFYSLQGEGFHTGKAAYFVRIGGCDIGCFWCDSKFSWQAELHPLHDVDAIVQRASAAPAKAVVVTGGEPTFYNLDFFCSELKKNGVQTFLETSGTYPLTGEWNWICLSPKIQTPPLPDFLAQAHELKVIITDENSFAWAETNALLVNPNCKLFLQPEWSNYLKLIDLIVEYIKENPKWNISLQAHKFMRIP